jgi:diguanylate cyclase (GGDEF)-like protein
VSSAASELLGGDWTQDANQLVDALPDAIAVIDAQGVIVRTNRAWRMFGIDNGVSKDRTDVGVNYLEVCDQAAARGCADGGVAAAGIRAVLAGQTVESELEYACPSPAAKRWFLLRVTPLSGDHPGALVSHVNITRRKAAELELEHRASHDPLTGLANRSLLRTKLSDALRTRQGAAMNPIPCVGVLSLDLNGFKSVNDSYGHAAGDEVLLTVADRLRQIVRPQDTVARPGGDEFVVVAPRIGREGLTSLIRRIRAGVIVPHTVHGESVTVGASVGAHLASLGDDVNEALEAADALMYADKRAVAEIPVGAQTSDREVDEVRSPVDEPIDLLDRHRPSE